MLLFISTIYYYRSELAAALSEMGKSEQEINTAVSALLKTSPVKATARRGTGKAGKDEDEDEDEENCLDRP